MEFNSGSRSKKTSSPGARSVKICAVPIWMILPVPRGPQKFAAKGVEQLIFGLHFLSFALLNYLLCASLIVAIRFALNKDLQCRQSRSLHVSIDSPLHRLKFCLEFL